MLLADKKAQLIQQILDIGEQCGVSQSTRATRYTQYSTWMETGRGGGGLSNANLIYSHIDRLHSHIFSPTDLKFGVEFDDDMPASQLAQAERAGRELTRLWRRSKRGLSIGSVFALGVRESLLYGCCPIKCLVSGSGNGRVAISARLVMPWQFGVFNETDNSLAEQEAIRETTYLTKPQVWRRLLAGGRDATEAQKLFDTITNAGGTAMGSTALHSGVLHQVLSTAQLDTSLTDPSRQIPGGIVQTTTDPSFPVLGPQIAPEVFPLHELWVKDDDRGDWVTFQYFDPGIVISGAPPFRRSNLFVPGLLPYALIRPNDQSSYLWGRSELVDLMMPQQFLTVILDDTKRLFNNQVDKLLAFSSDGLNEETYAQFRSQGFINLGPGGKVEDVTPQFPPATFQLIQLIKDIFDEVGGFANMLTGRGEAGVRAANHAEALLRTASPRLRDRALLVEHSCAEFGQVTLAALAAKSTKPLWAGQAGDQNTQFLLSQLMELQPDVVVDSHSSSPVYLEDFQDKVAFGLKSGFIGGDSAIEMLDFPNQDILLERYKIIQQNQQAAAQAQQAFALQLAGVKHQPK